MLFAVGAVTVLICVLGGFYLHGGNLAVLWQPTELLEPLLSLTRKKSLLVQVLGPKL